MSAETGADLVVPQTVLVEHYWTELIGGVEAAGIPVRAFTLHVDEDEHVRRVQQDALEQRARNWRRDRRITYDAALPWLTVGTHLIDTTALSPDQVAAAVATSSGI